MMGVNSKKEENYDKDFAETDWEEEVDEKEKA